LSDFIFYAVLRYPDEIRRDFEWVIMHKMRLGVVIRRNAAKPGRELCDFEFRPLADDTQDFDASFLDCVEFPTNVVVASWVESMATGHFSP